MIKLNGKKAEHPVTRVSPKIRQAIQEFDKTVFGTNWNSGHINCRCAFSQDIINGIPPVIRTEDIEYEDITNKRLGE